MKVIKLKVKSSHYQFLNRVAVETNVAWNQLNEIYNQHVKEQKYLSFRDEASSSVCGNKSDRIESRPVDRTRIQLSIQSGMNAGLII